MADDSEAIWQNIQKSLPAPTPTPSRDSGEARIPPPAAASDARAAEKIWSTIQSTKPAAPQRPSTSWPHALWEGIKRGAQDVLEGGAQIGARMQAAGPEEGAGAFDVPAQRQALPGRVDEAVRQSAQAYAQDPAVRAHPIVAGGGRIGGNIAATAPLLALPGIGLGGGAARTGAGILARGAGAGGAGAALQPVVPQQPQKQPYGTPSGPTPAPLPQAAPARPPITPPAIPAGDYWTEKMKQVGIGAGIGAAIPGVGSMFSPRLPSARAVETIPQDASYLARAFRPLYNFFTGAEERTDEGFARTIARQVLDPIGGNITGRPTGHALLRETERQITDVYDQNLPHITLSKAAATAPDQTLDDFVATMSSDHIRRFNELVDRNLTNRFGPGDVMDGTTFQRARAEMGKRARSWLGTNDDELGRAVMMRIDNLQNAVVKTNPPEFAQPLQRANESWRLWVRMRQAGSNPRKDGDFSPDDLLRAVYRQERGAAWSGDRPLQGYAQAARAAMGRRPTSLLDLARIFHRYGIIGEVLGETVGPVARAAKAATPAISPALGAGAGQLEQALPQRRVERRIPDAPYVGPAGM